MKKNVASQVIGAQMVSATDGSAFTGSVTVSVTGDGGTQATGSVGSGACTHEGNGYHTYAPAQAETNYDIIAFTFTGTGAIPVTVQVYTSYPQTGDNYARLGAPAGASVSADVAAVKAETASIVADTNELQTDWANGGRLDLILDARASQTSVDTMAAYVDTEVAAILADTNELQTDWANGGRLDLILDARASQTSVDTVATYIDTEVASILAAVDTEIASIITLLGTPAGASLAADIAAIEAQTDDIGTAGAGLTAIPWNAAWDAEVQSEVDDALNTAISELGVAAPSATPTIRTAIMLLYMALRNRRQTTATADTIQNDAGTTIATATLSDDTVTFTKGEYA